jgi:hypothetical protein
MKRILVLLICLSLLVFALAGVSQAGQGRMAGMGDPYGLVADPSDFLTHPAKLATGEGVRFYGHYRFTYTDVMDWDYDLDWITLAGVPNSYYDTSGDEMGHEALLGAAFPLGPGRMGVFLTYDGIRGDYDGDEDQWNGAVHIPFVYDLESDLDSFALRLLYGLPVAGMDAGVELGMAYQDEKQETWINRSDMTTGSQNYPWAALDMTRNLLPYMIPYDSDYWELLWKVGMGKQFDSIGIDVVLRGGYIISSDNNYDYFTQSPAGVTTTFHGDVDGDVDGWRIGSDIWFRYGLGDGMTLPFLVSVDYSEKNRDGDGIGTGASDAGNLYDYDHKKTAFDLKVGGGLEKELGDNALIAAGIYYNYLQRKDDFLFSRPTIDTTDNSEFPSHQEHMAILRLAGEKEFSPIVALRMGLDFFYGWVKEDFKNSYTFPPGTFLYDDISLDGSHWGIGASLGGSVQFNGFTLEPFVNAGWQAYDLTGDGDRTGVSNWIWDMDLSRSEWYIGGGVSFLYDLP